MSRLTDLLRQVRQSDTQLARDLEAEITQHTNRRTFGLVFEAHQPEAVELPGRAIRRGDKVRILAPRGESRANDDRLWRVQRVERVDSKRLAHLSALEAEDLETQTVSTDDLVVVAEFNDRIYPGLVETGRVERGNDKPFHTVINAENYHALEMLTYTHRHAIDAIYIDPPYNSGARDWKYNNNYVEGDDDYRHSKWLAFMERRLRIARELLNPNDSVLIVTIDEKEVHRLALLLEQTFPEAHVQMVSTLINPKGVARGKEFYRVDEYIFFVYFGFAAVHKTSDPMILAGDNEVSKQEKSVREVRWGSLLRSGTDAQREDRQHQFYPIFLEIDTGKLHSVGDPLLPVTKPRDTIQAPEGTLAVWPIRKDGSEGRWMVGNNTLRKLFAKGYATVGRFTGKEQVSFRYVTENIAKQIESGSVLIVGRDTDGAVILKYSEDIEETANPKTMWNKTSHSASEYGSTMLREILPRRKFPFPKSLYAVEDALRFFVKNKPNAIVLDFFAGSGTTAHAVMRLNKQDGGSRQCISVTNNEVSADEQRKLRKAGLRPGDPEWEALGICDYVTKPRVTAAITGMTPENKKIKGNYRFTDEFPMADGFEENAAFFTLTYETPLSVRHHRAFERIAPMLWLKAGSRGRIICDLGTQGWDIAEAYAVLEDFDQADEFLVELQQRSDELLVFLITDDDAAFQMACRELAAHHTPVRLYESYLHNFQLNIEGTV